MGSYSRPSVEIDQRRTLLGPNQASMMERFAKIASSRKSLTIFAKELHHRCLTGLEILLQICLKRTIMETTDHCGISFPSWEYTKTTTKVFLRFTMGKAFLIKTLYLELTIKWF